MMQPTKYNRGEEVGLELTLRTLNPGRCRREAHPGPLVERASNCQGYELVSS